MRRGSEFVFSRVPTADIPRSSFNRTHEHKTTFDAGRLIPVYVDEVLPGDTFVLNMSCFARLMTPYVPIMDNLFLDAFFFFVPNRLTWDNWQRFMGEQDNPGPVTSYLVPQVNSPTGGWAVGSLGDYFGLPVGKTVSVNALPFRAYNLIYNEWFRDENLCVKTGQAKGDGPDNGDDYLVKRRTKRHDYFTSCLPWPQKGPSVETPIGATAPVLGDNTTFPSIRWPSNVPGDTLKVYNSGGPPNLLVGADTAGPGTAEPFYWVNTGMYADLAQATALTINKLRQAFQVQKLLERDARGGTRYTEILRAHFGVVSPDARLQRPEYLGGGQVRVNINPVAQTSGSPADLATGYTNTPAGNVSAFGTLGGSGIGFTKSFVEHGYVIGLIEVRAELTYQNRLDKMWSRRDKYEFYWPALAHLGEQAVLNKEIYYSGAAGDEEPFGYQERWAEYRYYPSKITGKFRSGVSGGSLDIWHLAEDFQSAPALNQVFIEDQTDVPLKGAIVVTTEPQFLFDSVFNIRCVRPMPTYSVPGYIDHF